MQCLVSFQAQDGMQMDDNALFPKDAGTTFPSNFMDIIKRIFKRLFRVYAHIYHTHFVEACNLKLEAHLNTCFKHFICFAKVWSDPYLTTSCRQMHRDPKCQCCILCARPLHRSGSVGDTIRSMLAILHNRLGVVQEFGLVDNKEMVPLQELIDKLCASAPPA